MKKVAGDWVRGLVYGGSGRHEEGRHMKAKVIVQAKLKLSLCITKHDAMNKY
jgi:hypothetical protein